jgi:hypothetical protein
VLVSVVAAAAQGTPASPAVTYTACEQQGLRVTVLDNANAAATAAAAAHAPRGGRGAVCGRPERE